MTTTTTKTTKKACFEMLAEIVNAAQANGIVIDSDNITFDSLNDFIENEISILNNKAVAAKERASKKKAAGDALRAKVYDVLSDTEFMIIDDIVKALDDEDVSPQMVTSRLKQLVDNGQVKKDTVTKAATAEGGKSRKLSAYCKIV